MSLSRKEKLTIALGRMRWFPFLGGKSWDDVDNANRIFKRHWKRNRLIKKLTGKAKEAPPDIFLPDEVVELNMNVKVVEETQNDNP